MDGNKLYFREKRRLMNIKINSNLNNAKKEKHQQQQRPLYTIILLCIHY